MCVDTHLEDDYKILLYPEKQTLEQYLQYDPIFILKEKVKRTVSIKKFKEAINKNKILAVATTDLKRRGGCRDQFFSSTSYCSFFTVTIHYFII